MKYHRTILVATLALVCFVYPALAQQADESKVKEAELGNTPNVHVCGTLFLAGQPGQNDVAKLKAKGIKRVITLRTEGEIDWNEAEAILAADMEFVPVPFRSPDTLTDDVFDQVRKLLAEKDSPPTLLHCGSANRVGAVWMVHRVLDEGVSLGKAIEEAREVGLRTPGYLEKAKSYIERHAEKE